MFAWNLERNLGSLLFLLGELQRPVVPVVNIVVIVSVTDIVGLQFLDSMLQDSCWRSRIPILRAPRLFLLWIIAT